MWYWPSFRFQFQDRTTEVLVQNLYLEVAEAGYDRFCPFSIRRCRHNSCNLEKLEISSTKMLGKLLFPKCEGFCEDLLNSWICSPPTQFMKERKMFLDSDIQICELLQLNECKNKGLEYIGRYQYTIYNIMVSRVKYLEEWNVSWNLKMLPKDQFNPGLKNISAEVWFL